MIPLGFEKVERIVAMPVHSGFRVARLAELNANDDAAWCRLTRDSGADSVFASDWFVRAVLTHFDPGCEHRLFIAIDALGEWDGVAVLTAHARLGRVRLGHWCGLTNPNQFTGMPLVRRGREGAFWSALLAALDRQATGEAALRLSDCPADHRVTRALLDHCGAQGRAVEQLGRRERAALLSSHALATQMDREQTPKRQARLRSLERKLERDHGPPQYVQTASADDVDAWIAHFLALEAKGWKGRGGSALASSPGSAGLFIDTVRAAHAGGAITCLSLKVGGQAIAMSSFFMGSRHGFGFKCSFDEAFASYAPGILLLRRIMTLVGEWPEMQFDSCSAATEVTINALWPDRRAMLDLCIAIDGPMAGTRYAAAMSALRAWHWWKNISAVEAV